MVDSSLQALVEQRIADRARAKRDKYFLANYVLGFDFQECHAELFSCFLQYDSSKPWDAQSEIKDRMILWSRGHYKTTAIVVEIIQAIINFPNIRILLMQGSIPVTRTLLKQVAAHFTGEAAGSHLRELFPEFCGDKKQLQLTQMQFVTCARTQLQLPQATVTVASPKSIKTGQHYDAFFGDDLVNESNYRNPKLIAKVKEDFTNVRPLMDPAGAFIFISGTRWAFGDLYEEIMRWQAANGKWIISIKDCWSDGSVNLPDAQKVPRFPRFTKKNGEQAGFTTEQLLQMQADDPANFACQYLNKPVHTSQQHFTTELLYGACVTSNSTPPLSDSIIVLDLASSTEEKSDDSVITVGKIDQLGVGYLCDMRGGQWAPMEFALNVIDVCLKYRPVKLLMENTASCKYFAETLRLIAKQKNIYLPIDFIKVSNQADAKNIRVISLAGVIKRGRFKFLAGLPKFDQLVEQASEFPKGRYGHDDYIDTAALLYIELSKQLIEQPIRRTVLSPILALMAQNEKNFAATLTQNENHELDTQDITGFE